MNINEITNASDSYFSSVNGHLVSIAYVYISMFNSCKICLYMDAFYICVHRITKYIAFMKRSKQFL